jgi:hypothetical protein
MRPTNDIERAVRPSHERGTRTAGGCPFGLRIADRLIERQLRRVNPALVTLYRERLDWYERVVDDIPRRSTQSRSAPPYVLGLRPPAGSPVVGQLERRPAVLAVAAADAERLVGPALRLNTGLRPAVAG